MSVTTTDNARMIALRHALADYGLHHSQPSDADAAPAPAPDARPVPRNVPSSNPPDWEDQWRRVPSYRPANDQLDDQRETFNNEIERNFIRVMFGGVNIMASASWYWRQTVGRFNSDWFKYRIGGEW